MKVASLRGDLIAGCIAVFSLASPAWSNWPQWRGPNALGVSSEENLPLGWHPEAEGSWKIELPGIATSTPIVWEDAVFVTSQVGKSPVVSRAARGAGDIRRGGQSGRVEEGDEGILFVVQAFHLEDGRELWRFERPSEGALEPAHAKHNLATPSPVTDGERLIVWFGTGQVVCLDLEGKEIWRRNLAEDYGPFEILYAHGSSPVLHRERVIFLCDHQREAYLLALDKTTGEPQWRAERGEGVQGYSTPFVVPPATGAALAVSSEAHIAFYDANSGELLSTAGERGRLTIGAPVWANGVLYASRGYNGPFTALRLPEGEALRKREVPRKPEVLWRIPTGAPGISSLLQYQGLIYMADENGVISAVDIADGSTVWKERVGGFFSASPVAADGMVYLVNEDGELFVIEAGRSFRLVERSELGGRILASPAISRGRILVRSDEHLFALGGR